jgi:fermentation-respiration switch protein FrsA (DUF1100 family)
MRVGQAVIRPLKLQLAPGILLAYIPAPLSASGFLRTEAMHTSRQAILLVLCVSASCAGCSSLGRFSPVSPLERSLAFQPAKYPAGEWQPSEVPVEDAWFLADDGTKLHGWFLDHAEPRAVALVLHGNGGNITLLSEALAILNQRHRLAVMAVDYRGYGQSEGRPTETGILQDARAARRWLSRRVGVSEREIVLMGHSLGGSVAVDLAANDGARGLVLTSTFTSLPDVAKSHMPLLPVRAVMTMRMESLRKISNYHGPLLISHGDADEVIPIEQGFPLFEAANEPKQFIRNRGGRHNDPQPEAYRKALDEFIAGL